MTDAQDRTKQLFAIVYYNGARLRIVDADAVGLIVALLVAAVVLLLLPFSS